MKRIVFYSWQSDLPNPVNRTFIQEALEDVAKKIKLDDTVGIEPVIDRDTQGVAGAPDIARTIFQKVGSSDVVVADVSIINKPQEGRACPNPNVLIELGYAFHALGEERIVLVFNLAYGELEDLPFDLRQRRAVTYNVPPGMTDRTAQRKEVRGKLESALRVALAGIKAKKADAAIFSRDGSPEPISVSGREASAQDASLVILSCLLTVVNYTPRPVRVKPQRLIVDGADWPPKSLFFQPLNVVPSPRYTVVTVPGSGTEDYKFNLMFPMENCPEKRLGVVFFQIDETEEPLPLKVQFH